MLSSFDLAQLARVLSSLLAVEKDQTRNWLRNEMDRLMDPMLDSIFQRLNNKLVNANLNQSGNCGNCAQMNSSSDHVESPNPQSLQPSSLIAQPSTSVSSSLNAHSRQAHTTGYEPEYDPEILAQVKREIKEEEIEMALQNAMNKSLKSNLQIEDYDEYEEDQQFSHILQHSPSQLDKNRFSSDDHHHHMSHNTAMTFDEHEQLDNQAIYDDNNHQANGQVNKDTQQDWDEPEIEEEGDDEQMIHIEEGEEEDVHYEAMRDIEDNESRKELIDATPFHLIEQSQVIVKLSGRTVKRKKLHGERIPVKKDANNRDNQKDTDEEKEVEEQQVESNSLQIKRNRPSRPSSNTKPSQITTLGLRCPQCGLMFAKDKLNKHLKEVHSIDPFRCHVHDCAQSFENHVILGHHLAQSHQSTSQWHCDQCDHHFPSYRKLSGHHIKHHQLGHFQCSACAFTAEYKQKVYDHSTHKHRTPPVKKCLHSGCPFGTTNAFKLKQHARVHLGIKPYRCKWPACHFASNRMHDTIRHIHSKHFARNSSSVQNGEQQQFGDPKVYVEVVHQLL